MLEDELVHCWHFLASLLELAMMSKTASMIFLHNYKMGSASAQNYHCSILPESIQGVVFIFFPKESMAKGININIYMVTCVYMIDQSS
jgi:hypothetical protein